jgi:hypothetical protein
MWMQLFTVALAAALALAVGAVALESEDEAKPGNLPMRDLRQR